MTRLPLVDPKDLAPELAKGYEVSKLDIFLLSAQARTVFPAFRMVTQAIFTTLAVPPAERELVVLAVAHLERGEYPWAQHVPIALDCGLSQAKIDAIAAEHFADPVLTEREKALLAFTRQVVKSVRVDDSIFNALADFYDPRQIVEIFYVIGVYMMVSRLSEACELPIDDINGVSIARAAAADPLPSTQKLAD